MLIADPFISYAVFTVLFSVIGFFDVLVFYQDRVHEALIDAKNWPAQDVWLFIPVLQWQRNVSPVFYAGMLPSIWLWIFILASFFTRTLAQGEPALKILRYSLDIRGKPFRIVGTFAAALAFVISSIIIAIA